MPPTLLAIIYTIHHHSNAKVDNFGHNEKDSYKHGVKWFFTNMTCGSVMTILRQVCRVRSNNLSLRTDIEPKRNS